MGSRTCIVKMCSFDMSPVVKGCDGNVRVTTKVIGYLVPGANRDSPSRLPSSPLFVSPASQLSPPDVQLVVRHTYIHPRPHRNRTRRLCRSAFRLHPRPEQQQQQQQQQQDRSAGKGTGQGSGSECSRRGEQRQNGPGCTSLRGCTDARLHGQRATGDGADEICRVHRSCLLRRQISLLPR